MEDGSLKGGLYGAVCEYLAARDAHTTVRGIGIPDRFIPQARQDEERRDCGLDTEGILAEMQKLAEKAVGCSTSSEVLDLIHNTVK